MATFPILILPVVFFISCISAMAQFGGAGGIQGTVQDPSGAVVPGAEVTAMNVNTGVATKTTTTAAGVYSISPLIPGEYTVTVSANGFQSYQQENLTVEAARSTGLNIQLQTGSATETVTVTDRPPALNTTDAQLGGLISNKEYTELPVMITGGQQRDITQFSNLLPGAQAPPGGRSSIIGGTGQRLGELYVDGLPITTASQQGDNRPVFNVIPLEAVDSVQVISSGFSAQYQGAGLENYSTHAGTNEYHGSVFEYIRNTAFDAWTFTQKGATEKYVDATGAINTRPARKTPEHQNEYGFTIGGPISIPHLFSGHDRLFFFATFDKFRSSIGANKSVSTVPTTAMRSGDFRELLTPANGGTGTANAPNYKIYDPTTQAACTAFYGTPCRYQYGFTHGATATDAPVQVGEANVIPAGQLSPITQYLQKFLPDPTTGDLTNNYLGGLPSGYDNWLYSGRIDYAISQKHRLSMLITGGNRHAIPYTATSSNFPVPYLSSTLSTVAGHYASLEESWTITPHLVNQFKYGFMNFGGPPVRNATNGITDYMLKTAGVTGLPAGQASENFPGVVFGGSNAQTSWAQSSTGNTSVSETYTLVDNLQWVKGAHSMTFGFQYQWLEINASAADTNSLPVNLNFSTNDTGNLSGPSSYASNTGYSYASFLLGAVGSTGVTQQNFSVLGGRYHPFSPYFQDDWKITPKLTLNLGLRWDYFPSYREAQDRWSYLSPDSTNPLTGNKGALMFAGNRGEGFSCNCRTPVHTYLGNIGPRVGFAYQADSKTVFRGAYALLYTHAGGTGGAAGAGTGAGQAGFNSSASFADTPAGPAFYLNNNPAFSAQNTNFGGPGYVLPAVAPITASSQGLNTGYYVTGAGAYSGNGATAVYADPYVGGRSPQISFFNFGMQREFFKDFVVTMGYVGTQAHFIAGATNMRGLYSNQMNPSYLALGVANCGTAAAPSTCLNAAATPANLAKVQAATGVNLAAPYAGYTAAAALTANASIAHMLTWMPQYPGVNDIWGNVANTNYNAFQLTADKRLSHGVAFTVNYTYSRNIDDAGTARSGWALPAGVTSDGRTWSQNRIDRSLSINNLPQLLNVYGTFELPFGKNHMGGKNAFLKAVASGWQLSEIFQYGSGLPLAIVATCTTSQNTGQGTCMPDFNPSFHGSARTNVGWSKGVTVANLGTNRFLNGYISKANDTKILQQGAGGLGVNGVTCASSSGPFCNSNNFQIGNATRIAPYGLRGPSTYRLAMTVNRTFDISDRFKFLFRVDCQNVTNHTTFGNNASNNQITVNVNSANYGALNFASADSRAFQFSGRIKF